MRYNIVHGLNISASLRIIFLIVTINASAQEMPFSKYGVPLVNSTSIFLETVKKDSLKKMVDLESSIPGIVLDLRYATLNNFMKRRMYPKKTFHTFLRLPAARALLQVQQELNRMGYGIKIYDAYRPYSVTEKFWELIHDDRYVADPSKGSGHNRGVAVDLTIIDLKTKKELAMPTGFDSFSDSAHHDFMNLPAIVLQNRKLLKESMEKFGFVAFATEWWHYSLPNPEKYEVLDLGFNQLWKLRATTAEASNR
ncbi:MAG TPA: M15 family metallopeptidase [Puia sp.]|nr:M15 family metallopeptidase [Puia sp.]